MSAVSRSGTLGPGSDSGSYSLTMRPSPLIYLTVGLVICWTIPTVLRKAQTESEDARIIRRSTIAVGVIVFVSIVLSVLWFALVQPEALAARAGYFLSPFPFGTVDFSIEPASH